MIGQRVACKVAGMSIAHADSLRKFLALLLGAAAMTMVAPAWAEQQPATRAPEPWATAARTVGADWRELYAIALQESQMAFSDGARPWPWTINSPVTGPLRFDSKEQAVAKVREILARGVENIDVGLMQINLRWHAHRVNYDVAVLFDPMTNIAIAAEILNENLARANGDFGRAVALYHSSNNDRGKRYAESVRRRLDQILKVY